MGEPQAPMPNLRAPLDLEAARRAVDVYERATDAEFITDEAAFARSYGYAAHSAARHLRAALARVAELETERDEALTKASDADLLAEQARRGQRMPWDFTPDEYLEYRRECNRLLVEDAEARTWQRAIDALRDARYLDVATPTDAIAYLEHLAAHPDHSGTEGKRSHEHPAQGRRGLNRLRVEDSEL